MEINTLEIYNSVKQIAKVLNDKKETLTRSELAFNLREKGIQNDSLYVSKLVFDAYQYFKDPLIKTSFRSNNGASLLVDDYALIDSLYRDDHCSAFLSIEKHTGLGEGAIQALEHSITKLADTNPNSGTNYFHQLIGASRIDKIKECASVQLEKYTDLISCYLEAKTSVKYCVSDFVFFREKLLDIYQYYTDLLLDVYGDSIKVIDPKLFDFDSIEWLDTEGMFQQVELQFNSLINSSQTLIGEISDNFNTKIKQAVQSYKTAGNRGLGIAMVGIHIMDHYISAQQRTQTIERDFISLQTNIKRDINTIKSDHFRLFTIYKTLNDLQIPKAKGFYSYCNSVMSNELSRLINSMYQTDELAKLKKQRESLNIEHRTLKNTIIDIHTNIQYYNDHIIEANESLSQIQPLYLQADSAKPLKPFFLFNIFSFGALNKSYNRSIWEWQQQFGYIVNKWKDLKNDITLYQQEISELQMALKSNRIKYEQLKMELNTLKAKTFTLIKDNDTIKRQIATHLKAIINLLKIAKEIISIKLDEKQVKAVSINKKNADLSTQQENAINDFISLLKLEEYDQSNINSNNEDLTENVNSVKIKLSKLLEEKLKLEVLRQNHNIAILDYDRQLELLRQDFSKYLSVIDNKAEVLQSVLVKLHQSNDLVSLREALLSFSESHLILSDCDIDEFILGTKTIEI